VTALAQAIAPPSPTAKEAGDQATAKEAANASGAAATTESVLDALAAGVPPKAINPRRQPWPENDPRALAQTPDGMMGPEKLLGHWVDSQGNAVHVLSTDAYDVRLAATLSRPPRPDINLSVKPVVIGGGWQCGHSLLDPVWSSETQLHWVAMDGRVSVWVRPQEDLGEDDGTAGSAGGSAELPLTTPPK